MGGRVVFREWFRKLSLPRKLSRRGSIWRACLESVSKIRGVCRAHVKHRTPDRPMKKGFLLIIFVNTVFFFFPSRFIHNRHSTVFRYKYFSIVLDSCHLVDFSLIILLIIWNRIWNSVWILEAKINSAKYIYIFIWEMKLNFLKILYFSS